MQEGSISAFAREAKGLCADAATAFRGNLLLLAAGAAWWGSHFLLLWNASIATLDSFVSGYDGRFVLTIAGTVIALGAMTLLAWHKPRFSFSAHRSSYVLFASCASFALALIVVPAFAEQAALIGAMGAFLSGVGNSFALVLYGELHARMGFRYIPLACAVESVVGVAVFLLLSPFPMVADMLASAVLVLAAAALYFRYARSAGCSSESPRPARVDMTVRSLVVLAVLTGFAYGLVHTFAIGGLEASGISAAMASECLGTCLCALLLLAIFLLQWRQSLFEQCLLFVVPLVATGMLLSSMQGVSADAPLAVNTGGFACFFNLMWYFAAVLAAQGEKRRVTFLVALLFFGSQSGQLLGALVPAQFANAFSSGLMYLLLLMLTIFLYWRAKAIRSAEASYAGKTEDGEKTGDRSSVAPGAPEGEQKDIADEWTHRFGFSPREVEIAQLLMRRTPYRQISTQLFVSENTVKTHVRNIYKKAGVSSREELLEKLNELAKKG